MDNLTQEEARPLLFPSSVVLQVASAAKCEAPLFPEEEQYICNANAKRRREFTAGRACARNALLQLGAPGLPLHVGAHREPLWPPGIVGSIAHTERLCAVAVSDLPDLVGLGLDLEIDDPLPEETLDLVCRRDECAQLASESCEGLLRAATVLFSAKEAFYKCVFPIIRIPLEFRDVRVRLDADGVSFEAEIVGRCVPPAAQGPFVGRLARTHGHVWTGVAWHRTRLAIGPTRRNPS
jgi:4'-phosphopantetheinyl transferase EntD